MNLLFVDDDLFVNRGLIGDLRGIARDIIVDTICDPRQALDHLTKYDYEVVISDYVFTSFSDRSMNGIDLLHNIRKIKSDYTKLILISSLPMEIIESRRELETLDSKFYYHSKFEAEEIVKNICSMYLQYKTGCWNNTPTIPIF